MSGPEHLLRAEFYTSCGLNGDEVFGYHCSAGGPFRYILPGTVTARVEHPQPNMAYHLNVLQLLD